MESSLLSWISTLTMSMRYFEDKLSSRLLQINHCAKGRYSYAIGDDKIVYFGKGDLCVSIYDLTKTISDFPLGYYEGLEIFIDVDDDYDKVSFSDKFVEWMTVVARK